MCIHIWNNNSAFAAIAERRRIPFKSAAFLIYHDVVFNQSRKDRAQTELIKGSGVWPRGPRTQDTLCIGAVLKLQAPATHSYRSCPKRAISLSNNFDSARVLRRRSPSTRACNSRTDSRNYRSPIRIQRETIVVRPWIKLRASWFVCELSTVFWLYFLSKSLEPNFTYSGWMWEVEAREKENIAEDTEDKFFSGGSNFRSTVGVTLEQVSQSWTRNTSRKPFSKPFFHSVTLGR